MRPLSHCRRCQSATVGTCCLRPVYSDATQLSPAIGNATDPVEQRTANQRKAGQSSRVELCRYKRALTLGLAYERRTAMSRELWDGVATWPYLLTYLLTYRRGICLVARVFTMFVKHCNSLRNSCNCRHETFSIDWQWQWDHVKFAMWQHRAIGRWACSAVPSITYILSDFIQCVHFLVYGKLFLYATL